MQVNYGINLTGLLGLIYIFLGIVYFVSVIIVITRRANRLNYSTLLYILQAIILPILLVLCGGILLFYGWSLYPIFQFQQLLLFILITYFVVKILLIDRHEWSLTNYYIA